MMKHYKKAGLIGGFMTIIYLALYSYQISQTKNINSSIKISLFELGDIIIISLILLSPTLILIFSKELKIKFTWVVWLYPFAITLALQDICFFNYHFENVLLMDRIVFPFCLLFSIYIYLVNQLRK